MDDRMPNTVFTKTKNLPQTKNIFSKE